MKTRAIVVDLDGTLCDIAHRRPLFDAGQLDEFHAKIPDDTPNYNVAIVIAVHIDLGYHPLIVTGRAEKYRQSTAAWLKRYFPEFSTVPVLMREDMDDRSDAAVKEWIYKTAIEPIYDVKLVLDDRDHVVNMWRRLGLECWQVAPGDY